MSELTTVDKIVSTCKPRDGHTLHETMAQELADYARRLESALTSRSEGFREGVEAAAKVCDGAYAGSTENDPWLDGEITASTQIAARIRTLSPRETDAKVGQGWIPEDALSFCEDCGMYVISKPPPPERL